MNFSDNFVDKLSYEYRARRERNASYSMRSFSRDISVNSGRLSQYFSKVRPVTPKAATRIMSKLGLSPFEQAEWMGLSHLATSMSHESEPFLLDQKVFELISEPLHFSLLSLIETKNFQKSSRWIAKKLRSTVPQVNQSIELLRGLGLIQDQGSKFILTHKQGVKSSDGLKSTALRQAHKKQLTESIEIIDQVPLELRDITSISFPADRDKLPEAKKLIKEFRRKLNLLMSGKNNTEVYRLQIQLIPMTNIEGQNEN